MMEAPRLFFHYKDFPLSIRTLFTGTLIVLGLGYAFGMLHVFNSHAGRDGEPGMSIDDIVIAYSGNKEGTRLEAALMGPMSGMLPPVEAGKVTRWVREGLDEQVYETEIADVIAQRCVACHDGGNPHIASLTSYEEVADVAEVDTGMGLTTLVKVSHIHMFGMTFIFFIMGFIFSYADVKPLWFKSAVIGAPFVAVILDIGSWYLTKFNIGFAWVVLISGGIMGVSFSIEWFVSMYQLWFQKRDARPDDAENREAS